MDQASAMAFVAFLKCEAELSEERAKRLRAAAAAIEANSVSADNNRKRKRETKSASKRESPGYTLFFEESLENIQKANGGSVPKDAGSIIQKQWSEIGEEEKMAWQYKAQLRTNQVGLSRETTLAEQPLVADGLSESSLPEDPAEDEDDTRKRQSRRYPPKSSSSIEV